MSVLAWQYTSGLTQALKIMFAQVVHSLARVKNHLSRKQSSERVNLTTPIKPRIMPRYWSRCSLCGNWFIPVVLISHVFGGAPTVGNLYSFWERRWRLMISSIDNHCSHKKARTSWRLFILLPWHGFWSCTTTLFTHSLVYAELLWSVASLSHHLTHATTECASGGWPVLVESGAGTI